MSERLFNLIFTLVRLIVNKQRPKSTPIFRDLLMNTNILKISNSDLQIISELKEIEKLYYNGGYHKAVKTRIEIYQAIYNKLGLGVEAYPKKLSPNWTSAIGHEALIGVLKLCAKYDMVYDCKREIDLPRAKKDSVLINIFSEFLEINYSDSPIIDVSHFPSNLHKFENLMLWRIKENSFEDQYSLLEKSFKTFELDKNENSMSFTGDQESLYFRKLQDIGLPKKAWFVVVHVKETPKSADPRRSATIDNYLKSCKFITDQGGWIIQVGFTDSNRLKLEKNFIDLRGNESAITNLQLFAMAKAFFYLGTITGFNVIAGLFKTPSLITNAVTLGRNTIFYNSQTRYLPKTVINTRENRQLGLREILETIEGFGDPTTQNLLNNSLSLVENTSEEIFEATKHFYEMLLNNTLNGHLNRDLLKKVENIRSAYSFTSTGFFSEPYLLDNPNWLDYE